MGNEDKQIFWRFGKLKRIHKTVVALLFYHDVMSKSSPAQTVCLLGQRGDLPPAISHAVIKKTQKRCIQRGSHRAALTREAKSGGDRSTGGRETRDPSARTRLEVPRKWSSGRKQRE